jgi:hypothetical protein
MNGLFVSIGAGPGIGGSTASRFAREGFDLVLAARDVSKLAPSALNIQKETGQHVETVALDSTDFSAVQQFSERFGPAASILHYNAAAMQKADVVETPIETTQRNLNVDILGALAAIKYFAPYMEKRRKGTILLTSGGLAPLQLCVQIPESLSRSNRLFRARTHHRRDSHCCDMDSFCGELRKESLCQATNASFADTQRQILARKAERSRIMADERPLLNELRTYREVLSVRNFQKYIVDEARNNGLPERLGKAVHALRRTRGRATPPFRNVLRTDFAQTSSYEDARRLAKQIGLKKP